MSSQIQITGETKVKSLTGVLVGTSGVVSSLNIDGSLGIPQLDVNGKILVSQLPNSVMEYKGTWDASTNTPTLVNGTGNQGDVYLCSVAGTVNFGAGAISFVVSDQVIYSGSIWQKASGSNGTVTSVAVTESGDALTITGSPITTSGTINIGFAGTNLQYVNGAGNLTTFPTLISSIGLSMPSAFSVSNSPLTANGTIAVTGAGYPSQYIRGDGTLADFPTSGGGGSSVSYYLNGGTSQGTIGGVTYYEMSKTADTGTGVDFTKSGDGFIVAFLTDAGDPAQLNIPAGNWNYEIYASMSANGGTPEMYAELYKYDGTTFTLISTSSNEILYDGTALNLYTFAMTVPSTTLAITDRLAVKLYATNSGGKTTTVHTQDSHLCQIITTFSTGITALNGLTAQVQYFATGTSGTDFAISSATATHTFNLPVASAANTGKLSSTDWSTFNGKVPYTGATGAVNLGAFDLTVNGVNVGKGAGSGLTYNTRVGALNFMSNTTGAYNSSFGYESLNANTTGLNNTAIGFGSLFINTTGNYNTAIGSATMMLNIIGSNNTAVGYGALGYNLGSNNIAVGSTALVNNTTGSNNTAIGPQAGSQITTGANNTLVGGFIGSPTISNNIILSDGAGNIRYRWDGTNNVFSNPISGTSATFSVNQNSTITNSFINTNTTNNSSRTILNVTAGNATLQIQAIHSDNIYITPSTATDTYLGYNNILRLLANGNATFSGSVAIGSSSAPSYTLDVSGTVRGTTSAYFATTSGSVGIAATDPVKTLDVRGTLAISNSSSSYWYMDRDDSDGRFKILTDGNSEKFSIATTGAATFSFTTSGYGITSKSTSNYSGILADTSTNTGGGYFAAAKNGTRYSIFGTTGAWLGDTSTDTAIVSEAASSNIIFYTNGSSTERMRITSGGNVAIGTGLAAANSFNFYQNYSGGQLGFDFYNSSSQIVFGFNGNTQTIGLKGLSGTGSRAVLADANGSLSAPVSDISVKQNIVPIGYGLNEILKMNPIWFDFIEEYKNYGEGRQNGNIAQEIEAIIPEAVFVTELTGKMGINYDQLHAVYIKAIQELQEQINELKNK